MRVTLVEGAKETEAEAPSTKSLFSAFLNENGVVKVKSSKMSKQKLYST